MKLYETIAKQLPSYKQLIEHIQGDIKPTLVVGLSDIHKSHFSYMMSQDLQRTVLIVTAHESQAMRVMSDINSMSVDNQTAVLYPSKDFVLRSAEVSSKEYELIRLGVLGKIVSKSPPKVIVASIEAVLQRTIPKQELIENSFEIDMDSTITTEQIALQLSKAGYENVPQIEGHCQYSIRGGIIDIYAPQYHSPIRIELWGDEIDTMSFFDIQTQRRTEDTQSVKLIPATEVIFGERATQQLENLIKETKNDKAKEFLQADYERISSGLSLNSYDKYIGIAYDSFDTLLSYLPKDSVTVISEYTDIRERASSYQWHNTEDMKQMVLDNEITSKLCEYNLDFDDCVAQLSKKKLVVMDTFAHSNDELKFSKMITVNAMQNSSFNAGVSLLKEEVQDYIQDGYSVVIMAGTTKGATALCHDLEASGIKASTNQDADSIEQGRVTVVSGNISHGIEYPEIRLVVISLVRQGESKKSTSRFKKGKTVRNLNDLEKGDLIVHVSYGIGIFKGIHNIEKKGISKDYIKIEYAGTDVLYIPITQLDLISKYIGPKEDSKVKLNSLSSPEWKKTKVRVKQAVEVMAKDLILLYAKRMETKGFQFSADTEWQKSFEQRFPYEETDDQLRCIEEIKEDMEKSSPMDRVLCGDVGFGKTEVAMRACFKAVMDSKQVAILCPTTILAWQHYQSFVDRFEGFPMKVEVLSRFRTPKQQKEILKELKEGKIDIVIGTHRVVQKDVEFADLGLAVVDEEQRFGVKHKEKFKEMFNHVDMLTLSATPIPRTLNMAISGIRDMSTIEQAPQNRYPVQTYVVEHNQVVINDAIRKEMRRGGQVYYIHNRIESIEQCVAKIKAGVPEARVEYAHGRMDEKEITKLWSKLMEHEIDVLVCTTIIETGVDVANCNTLIIENADNMGLSQLYQLRGRVGRSNRRAFAYLTFTVGKQVSEVAGKRLSAIREFTKFGSGFRIAMRDLEIRGAGNILGERQHGHMEAVGYDMYLRLLREAIAIEKGEQKNQQSYECTIDIKVSARIADSYIEDMTQRIDVYKKIASIRNDEDKLDVIDELLDRFGEPPKDVMGLIDIAMVRNIMAQNGVREIQQKFTGIHLVSDELNMQLVEKLIKAMNGRILVNVGEKPYIVVKPEKDETMQPLKLLKEVVSALKEE